MSKPILDPNYDPRSDGAMRDGGKAIRPRHAATLIVVRRDGDRWVFPVDEVDQVYRFSGRELSGAPATLARSAGRLTQGVFVWRERAIGYLDDTRLFQALRARIR